MNTSNLNTPIKTHCQSESKNIIYKYMCIYIYTHIYVCCLQYIYKLTL